MTSTLNDTSDPHTNRGEPDFLLIGGGFFGYAKEIKAELERRGRVVRWFEDRPAIDNLTKALVRFAPMFVSKTVDAYFAAIVAEVRSLPITDVLVIKGESLSIAAIHLLRKALPSAHFALYFWDSYRNMPSDSAGKAPLFDKVFSFDPVDVAADARLAYRPLFYLDSYSALNRIEQDIDLLFVGTAHSDRHAVIKRLSRAVPTELDFRVILYFPSRAVYVFRRILFRQIARSRGEEFIFKPLSHNKIQMLVARSRVILDIERPVQTGLTMRTIEVFGAGKKLITTNSSILRTDIFDANNVAVINRVRPVIPLGFFSARYISPPPERLKYYSLSGWLDDVLSR